MGRFNASKYDPANDSSTGMRKGVAAAPVGVLFINRNGQDFDGTADVLCHCGCGNEPQGKNSKFRMGHDARFKGALTRAHLAGVKVVLRYSDGEASHTAITVAGHYDTDRFSWTQSLRKAEAAQGDAVRAKLADRVPGASPKGPRVGDKKLIRVGRWEYTGQLAKIQGDNAIFEYATKSGEVKTVTLPLADAK